MEDAGFITVSRKKSRARSPSPDTCAQVSQRRTPEPEARASLLTKAIINNEVKHPLEHTWNLYYKYTETQCASMGLGDLDYKVLVKNIDTVELAMGTKDTMPTINGIGNAYHLMHADTVPKRSDPSNMMGYNLNFSPSASFDEVLSSLYLTAIGDMFHDTGLSVCGVTCTKKRVGAGVRIWLERKPDIPIEAIHANLTRALELDINVNFLFLNGNTADI